MATAQPFLAERLRGGETVVGTMIRMSRNPALVKIAGDADLDFIMLDFEHGDFTFNTVADMALVGRSLGVGVLVRVAELSRAFVSRSLDCGVNGVMAPMLESAEQARNLVDWCKYPPVGRRGLATLGGMSSYATSSDINAFMAESNDRVLAIAQIETVTAIDAIDDIAAVEGIDVLLVGPNDLAVSLGKPGDLTSPEETDAVERVAAAAERHGKVFAMHAGGEMLRRWAPRNMRMIMNGLDIAAMQKGLAQLAREARSFSSQATST